MTRPTPTQGAQSEAARVPRVSDEHLAYEHLRPWQGLKDADATDGLLLARDLRDARQASRDKDAVIADLERRLAEARQRNHELRQLVEKADTHGVSLELRADALQARLTEAEQRAATAERRGFEAGRDAAADRIRRSIGQLDEIERQARLWNRATDAFAKKAVLEIEERAIRALAPAVPQEGETTP